MGLNKAAKGQIKDGKADKRAIEGALNSFQYGQQRGGLSNPFSGVTNANAGLTNPFANQRVATEAAEFQAQRQDQSQANILDAVIQGGAGAGTSATALAQAATQSNQQITAGLTGQQQQIQAQSAQGEASRQQLVASGEARRQQLVGTGEQYILGLSEQRDAGKLAGLGAQYVGAQETINAGYKSIGDTHRAGLSLAGDIFKAAGSAVGAASDIRLKENIARIDTSPSGIPIYQFDYKDGSGKYEGAMSHEVPEEAVIKNFIGEYDGVDYSKIDVNFKQL